MLGGIAKIIVRSRIHRENGARQKKFLSWDTIEKIALILDNEDAMNKSHIDKFIEGTKKYVEVFYIETRSKGPSYGDWCCLSKKDSSFLNLPSGNLISELKTKKFDAVINTCSANNLFALSLCSALHANLKCCENDSFDLADLIIKRTEPFSLTDYLNDTVKYLKMIRA